MKHKYSSCYWCLFMTRSPWLEISESFYDDLMITLSVGFHKPIAQIFVLFKLRIPVLLCPKAEAQIK